MKLKLPLFKTELFTSVPKPNPPPSLPVPVNDITIHQLLRSKLAVTPDTSFPPTYHLQSISKSESFYLHNTSDISHHLHCSCLSWSTTILHKDHFPPGLLKVALLALLLPLSTLHRVSRMVFWKYLSPATFLLLIYTIISSLVLLFLKYTKYAKFYNSQE